MVALVVADGVISRFLIARGLAEEGNVFLQFWIGHQSFLWIKLFGSFLAAFLLWRVRNNYPAIIFFVTVFFVVYYTVLVFWSLIIFVISG